LTLFIPLGTDLPPNGALRSHTRNHSPYARSGRLAGSGDNAQPWITPIRATFWFPPRCAGNRARGRLTLDGNGEPVLIFGG